MLTRFIGGYNAPGWIQTATVNQDKKNFINLMNNDDSTLNISHVEI